MSFRGIPTIIFGTGATSREAYYIIEDINSLNFQPVYNVVGFVCENDEEIDREIVPSLRAICNDEGFEEIGKKSRILAVAIPPGNPNSKKKIFDQISPIKSLVYPNFIHPKAIIKQGVKMGYGNIVMEGSVIGIDASLGNFNLINTNSTIGHDTNIGSFNVINPLTAVSGSVSIGGCNLIGTGAKILQGLNIGSNNKIGAGAVLTKDLKDNLVTTGIPAKPTHINTV